MKKIKEQPINPGEPCIELKDVIVRFNIAGEKLDNLKEFFIKLVKHELRFKEFYALDHVSLTINKGESWALVGTNGAGKSTMLKLICGILSPYKGAVKVRGSIAPMIELGAGFDLNLTAQENIYINGAILGHTRKFMKEHYNDVVDFAELWDFMDLPIKNYSSGMRARLGFAVATIVDPDILIIDEVLEVGDKAFKKKCRDRIREMQEKGVTLIFVSHAKAPVLELCDHAVWLDHGKVQKIGSTPEVYEAYEQFLEEKTKKASEK